MQIPPPALSPLNVMLPDIPFVASEVDAAVWLAIVGSAVKIPSVNSYVYYFPQGHLEQSPSPSITGAGNNDNFILMPPGIPCRVLSVRFLTHPSSDQAFVKFLLQPLLPLGPRPSNDDNDDNDDDEVVSFAKVLTHSDANIGGQFSVPRFCADMILPALDYAADPPEQNLVLKDTHGVAWEFRHVYGGTPRRHLLTRGWSNFVKAKRLVAGDSLVFIKKKLTNELLVGVRRAQMFGGGSRDCGEVVAAIENAVRGVSFEVAYYPRAGFPEFVVKAEKVKEALRMHWSRGMRVRTAVEADDSSRLTWMQGVIAAVTMPRIGLWCGSPWRTLQVNWDDDPQSSLIMSRVSPWQVEHILPASRIDPDIPPPKKSKVRQDSRMLPNEEKFRLHTMEFTHSMGGHLNYSPLIPAGMQGARQDHVCTPGTSTSNGDKHHLTVMNELPEDDTKTISTVPSIGGLYSDSQSNNVHLGGTDHLFGQPGHSSSSFQLFGKTIQMPKP